MTDILYIIAIFLFIMWLFGSIECNVGGIIHILLVIPIFVLLMLVSRSRKPMY